jgi:hypothetical protein
LTNIKAQSGKAAPLLYGAPVSAKSSPAQLEARAVIAAGAAH